MAENKGFDLAGLLKGVSELDTEEQIVRLPLDRLDPDPDNFYSLDGLDELAGNIETVGLLDPIRVRPNGDRYTVVSGHRRRAACLLIRDGGNTMFDRGVPCIVEYGEASDAMRRLRLIYANAATRQLTSAEISRQAEEVERLLYELKEQGVAFPGRMRDHVAQACNATKSKLARLHAIRANLVPELLKLYDKGVLNESGAYELQKLPQPVQSYLAGKKKVMENGVSGDAAKICVDNCERYLHPDCKCPDGSACSHTLPRFYETATQRWAYCRGGCCLKCNYGESECPYQCKESKKKTEERRAKDRDDKAKAEEKEKSRRDENRAQLAGQYMALAVLTKAAGLKNSDIINIPGAYTVAELEAKATRPSAISDYDAREDRVFSKYSYVGRACEFADQIGVSVDFLLGRTDVPEVNRGDCHSEEPSCHSEERSDEESHSDPSTAALRASAQDDREKDDRKDSPDGWREGTPEREGWYAVRMLFLGKPLFAPRVLWWDGEAWAQRDEKSLRDLDRACEVVCWSPLPEEETT